MSKNLKYVISTLMLGVSFGLSGCTEEHPPVTTDPNQITPAMEKMKQEMMKAFQTKSLGKTPAEAESK